MIVTGTIEFHDIGTGAWAIASEAGETYQLRQPPAELQQESLKVRLEGTLRDDIMSVAALGPILEVSSFEVVA